MCAVAFGVKFEIDNESICNAIETYEPENKRSQVKITSRNTLILDCYNANPTSMKSALESFAENNSAQEKLIILGEMKELGKDSLEEHKKIVALAEKLHLHGYFVGDGFSGLDSRAILHHYNNVNELKDSLNFRQLSDKLVLLKGSRSVKLEELENDL